jgi:hypothetical protein
MSMRFPEIEQSRTTLHKESNLGNHKEAPIGSSSEQNRRCHAIDVTTNDQTEEMIKLQMYLR